MQLTPVSPRTRRIHEITRREVNRDENTSSARIQYLCAQKGLRNVTNDEVFDALCVAWAAKRDAQDECFQTAGECA